MTALLKKDIYTLGKQMKIILVMIAIFACMPGYSVSAMAVMYAAMLPITALAYDERAKWDSLAVMMPYSPVNLVLSKYLLGYLGILAASVISAAAQLVFAMLGRSAGEDGFASLAVLAAVALLLLALVMPLLFALGVEKGRIAFFILIAAAVAGVTILGGRLSDTLEGSSSPLPVLLLVALAAAVVLNVVSILISVALYRKRLRS